MAYDFVITLTPQVETKGNTCYDTVKEELGYEPITTFWTDFSIADKFGPDAVKDTYKRVLEEWKSDYKYLTELVMVLNHKSWEKYKKGDSELGELYSDLFYSAQAYAYANLKEQELDYFCRTTD